MYFTKKENTINLMQLGRIIASFQTHELPRYNNYYNYYKGRQAILLKQSEDGKPCNRIVANYTKNIVDNFQGYLTGKEIRYLSDQSDFDEVQSVLNYNDVHSVDSEIVRNALIFGASAEIQWVDTDGKTRFKPLDPRETIAIYDDTLEQNLIYAVRFYKYDYIEDNHQDSYFVEVYDDSMIRKYKSTSGFASFELIDEEPHYFGQVPISFLYLNREETNIFDQVIGLQDAYNTLLSSSVDDWESFCSSYLVMKGVMADAEDIEAMRENRAIMIDSEADVSYLTKNISDTQIQNLLKNVNDQIHLVSASPDFNDERFLSQSGISLKYKLIAFENQAGSIEAQMRKFLQRRIELIASILNLKGEELIWRDVQIIFQRNLPIDLTEIATQLNQFRGLVSNATLLAQIPFVTNPEEEQSKVEKENSFNVYPLDVLE